MTLRWYASKLNGTGTFADPFRSVLLDLVTVPSVFLVVDGRASMTTAAGFFLLGVDVTDAQHATLIASAAITYLPFEDASGAVVQYSQPISAVSPANQSTVQTLLEGQNIPCQGLLQTDLVRKLLWRAIRRFLLRQLLQADDFTQGLDTLVSAVSAAQRQNISATLTAWGFDTSVIVGADTIRQALVKLAQQAPHVMIGGDVPA